LEKAARRLSKLNILFNVKMFINSETRFYPKYLTLTTKFFLSLLFLTISSPSFSSASTNDRSYLLDKALAIIAMKRGDLSINSDLYKDPYALSSFKRWMKNPVKAPIEAQHKAKNLLKLSKDPFSWILELAKLGDIYSPVPLPLNHYTSYELSPNLPKELKEAIRLILDAIHTANVHLGTIRNRISPEHMRSIERYLYPDTLKKTNSREEIEESTRIRELREAISIAGVLDRRGIIEAGLAINQALAKAKTMLTEIDQWHESINSFSFKTDLGLVEIGGTGNDRYEKRATLIIDLGGNDLYLGEMASGKDGRCAIVLDLDGDDLYLGEDYTQGAGFWGIGILYDLAGDDLYRARHYSQGAGLFGMGLLIDLNGHDNYLGEKFVQAASGWGWGGLIDIRGEDTYKCQHSGQAYAEVLGISSLCDLKGNDRYISGYRAPDPREPDMNQSFSQGFAMGMRNLAAGGFAMLVDGSGNDLYHAQYFGQGASYWMGIGILYDENGKDTYLARRYAQGAGIHFSLGLLMDSVGNDHTSSWGVSQGCGHDYGIGILINESGNDTYVSDWLSLGASEANGVGIFVDNSGDDGYEARTGMAVGHFIESRRAGGVGLFIDAGGKDRYSHKGSDGSIWGSNRWNVGIDEDSSGISGLNILPPEDLLTINEEAEKRRKDEKARLSGILARSEKMPYPLNIEGMLSVGSHWGLERGIPEKAKEKLLSMDPKKSVPPVVNLLDTPSIGSLIFMNRFFKIHAFHAMKELIKKTGDPDSIIRSRAFHHLGELKDSRAIEYCVDSLNDPSWRIRSSAIRALGEILSKKRLEILVPMKNTLGKAFENNDPHIIESYLENDKNRLYVLSVIVRATPLDYPAYMKYAQIPADKGKEEIIKDFVRTVFDHLGEIIPLLEKWNGDIAQSEDIAKRLEFYINDPDPQVRRSAAYALAQMNYKKVMPEIITLLKDPHLWVRDTAVAALSLFQDDIIATLDAAMKHETPSFKILALDVLSRIRSDPSKTLIEKYLRDTHENVRRAARLALLNNS